MVQKYTKYITALVKI